MLLGLLLSPVVRVGGISIQSQSFFWPGGFMLAAAILFLLYVKIGKFHIVISFSPCIRGEATSRSWMSDAAVVFCSLVPRDALSPPVVRDMQRASISGPASIWAAIQPRPRCATWTSRA
jgi:hypothetical protein